MRRFPYLLEGMALLALLLLVVYALRGSVVGKAIANDAPCQDGARLASCLTDSTGSYLVEMSCDGGRWREMTTKCDCQLGPQGTACV